MTDPYATLGLSPHADEAEVRRRYLELVREFPPDRAPERFATIRAAYDELRDPARRLEDRLFYSGTTDNLDALAVDLRKRLRDKRIPLSVLIELAESS